MGGYPPQGTTPITVTRAEYIDMIPDIETTTEDIETETDKISDVEHETEWNTDPYVDDITHVALTEYPLTEGDMGTVTYPSDATEVRAILLPVIKAVNQACTTHHIGLKVQYNVNDLGWINEDIIDLTTNPTMGLAALDAVVDSMAQPLDVSAIIETGSKYEFRFVVESDNAGAVYYTTSFVLVLVYRMG